MSSIPSSVYALVDCNNFFASCERVFDPALRNKPVVVLSNNDGCVIARSNEAKELGIAMGEPAFKCQQLALRHGIVMRSSNFVLYGDMSNRVMSTLAECCDHMEIYSIDEAFLQLSGMGEKSYVDCCAHVRAKVRQHTGLPVSIGIATTKTLAKAANRIAKKYYPQGVFAMMDEATIDHWLSKIAVEDIWGIGHQKAQWLNRQGVTNALQLKVAPDHWIKKNLTMVTLKTVWELRGLPCLALAETTADRQSILTSRSFASDVTDEDQLKRMMAGYVSNAAQKLRGQDLLCGYIQVFLQTNRFKKEQYYSNVLGIDVSPPTAYTPTLIAQANALLAKIYRPEFAYKKAGVILSHLSPQEHEQNQLFNAPYAESRRAHLMQTVDRYNRLVNHGKIFLASQGTEQVWHMRQAHRSKRFTTHWDEILQINI